MTTPTALVTGASSGIGKAVAKALVTAGYDVVGTSRDARRVDPVDGVRMLDLDVASASSVEDVVHTVLAEHGGLDLLVNNAGIGALGAAEESTVEQDRLLFDVNVFGTMRVTKAVLPHMRERSRGRIVTVSSVLGLIPAPYMATYAATKHALEGWSESLDHEVREFGVRAVLVEPFYTATSFEANAVQPDNPLPAYGDRRKAVAGAVAKGISSGDAPEVVAAAVVKAATAADPALRYTAGRAGRITVLRRFTPASAFDKQIRKVNRLVS